jgi:soluble lytic murein transglycosylase-like protein
MRPQRILIAVALSAAAVPACAKTAAERAVTAHNDNRLAAHPYAVHVADAARRFGIPKAWIWGVMRVESGGNPHAVSRVGAMGLMQLMPATWAALRRELGLGDNPFDVRDNILAGAAYLRAMYDRYGNPAAMLAAYNAGPGRYEDYLTRGRPLPLQTRAYLAKLAPVIRGPDAKVTIVTALADPSAWRLSAIFVHNPEAAPPFNATIPERNDVTSKSDTLKNSTNPLFVRRTGTAQSR